MVCLCVHRLVRVRPVFWARLDSNPGEPKIFRTRRVSNRKKLTHFSTNLGAQTGRNMADVTGPDTDSDTDDTTAAQVEEALTASSRALLTRTPTSR